MHTQICTLGTWFQEWWEGLDWDGDDDQDETENREVNCGVISVVQCRVWTEATVEGYSKDRTGISSVQFSSVAELCPILCNPMNRSTPGLPIHYQLLEFTQTHVHWVGDAIQPSHPPSSPSPPAPSPSQHQGLSQWVLCYYISHVIICVTNFIVGYIELLYFYSLFFHYYISNDKNGIWNIGSVQKFLFN